MAESVELVSEGKDEEEVWIIVEADVDVVVFKGVEVAVVLAEAVAEDNTFVEVLVLVVDNVTPGFVVGIVTTLAVVLTELITTRLELVVVVPVTLGHIAAIIPPFFTIPSNVFPLTETPEQAASTSAAVFNNASSQLSEHPDVKSVTVQVEICES